MRCSDAGLLPLGVDYEVPQSLPPLQQHNASCRPSEEIYDPGVDEQALKESEKEKKEGCKRRRESTEGDDGDTREWKSANNFRSLPPDVPAAEDALNQTPCGGLGSISNACSTQQPIECEFGGMRMGQQLLPLQDRPYYREGFVRLPPLPNEKDEEAAMDDGTESSLLLEELRRAQPLSRFDSLYSLRATFPPVSQIVVFRRKSSMRST